jgi:hypothetical protein
MEHGGKRRVRDYQPEYRKYYSTRFRRISDVIRSRGGAFVALAVFAGLVLSWLLMIGK